MARRHAWGFIIFCCVIVGLAGCSKKRRDTPSAARTTAAFIAMFSDGYRDMFRPIPSLVDGSFTSDGDDACRSDRAEPPRHLVLRTDGGFRTCGGQFLPYLAEWGTRNDVIAVVCTTDEQVVVLGDGTLWARSDAHVPFRPAQDCSQHWDGKAGPCRDLAGIESSIGGPVDLCEFGSLTRGDAGD